MSNGNRCGHNPGALRGAASAVRHGRKGHPLAIQQSAAYVAQVANKKRAGLGTWFAMNSRKRRPEIIEAMQAVIVFLLGKDFDLDSLRCAKRADGFYTAPDEQLIANSISNLPEWKAKGWRFSKWRVRTILREFEQCGYIRRTEQKRHKTPCGKWRAAPRVIKFTRKFFTELGGKGLWRKVAKASSERTQTVRDKLAKLNPICLKTAVANWYKLAFVYSVDKVPPDPGRVFVA